MSTSLSAWVFLLIRIIRTAFSLITRKLAIVAENYRNKYNLAHEKVFEDLRNAIQYQEALKRIYIQMNRPSLNSS